MENIVLALLSHLKYSWIAGGNFALLSPFLEPPLIFDELPASNLRVRINSPKLVERLSWVLDLPWMSHSNPMGYMLTVCTNCLLLVVCDCSLQTQDAVTEPQPGPEQGSYQGHVCACRNRGMTDEKTLVVCFSM